MSNSVLEKARSLRESGSYEEYAALCKENGVPEMDQDQFWNGMTDDLPVGVGYTSAAEKMDAELKDFKGGQKAKAVSSYVAKAIKQFSKNERFAAAVVASKKTLSDCCTKVMENVGSSISDIEVYRRAAAFYFPGCKVAFKMEIEVDGVQTPTEEISEPVEPSKQAAVQSKPKQARKAANKSVMQISLFDM